MAAIPARCRSLPLDSLAFILDGISRIHRNPDAPIGGPKLRGFPMLTGEEFLDRTRPYGPMMQTVFKGWFAEVHDLWESVYCPRAQPGDGGGRELHPS